MSGVGLKHVPRTEDLDFDQEFEAALKMTK